jgi:hypothetical protein
MKCLSSQKQKTHNGNNTIVMGHIPDPPFYFIVLFFMEDEHQSQKKAAF